MGPKSIYFIISLFLTMMTMTMMTLKPLPAWIRVLVLECLDENGYQNDNVVSFPNNKVTGHSLFKDIYIYRERKRYIEIYILGKIL